jgi:hypothetical protein
VKGTVLPRAVDFRTELRAAPACGGNGGGDDDDGSQADASRADASGTVASLSWTVIGVENWHGFTVGIPDQ